MQRHNAVTWIECLVMPKTLSLKLMIGAFFVQTKHSDLSRQCFTSFSPDTTSMGHSKLQSVRAQIFRGCPQWVDSSRSSFLHAIELCSTYDLRT